MNSLTRLRVPSSSLRMVSLLWVALAIAGAGFQVATALEDAARAGPLEAREDQKRPEDELIEDPFEVEFSERNLENSVTYEEDLDDDQGLAFEDELEDDTLTQQDIEDINAARDALERIKMEAGTRATIAATPSTSTTVQSGNQYTITSHDGFGVTRYPNRYARRWWFYKGTNIQYIVINCPFFRIQWSRKCRKDKFGVFKEPFVRGIRRCGQIHGFWKKYDVGIKVVFRTDRAVRRAGFTCVVSGIPYPPPTTTVTTSTSTSTSTTTTSTTTTFAPGCPVRPTVPPVRTVVTSCANIQPGYDYCSCVNLAGGICLTCYICTACDMEFFAVHDFSGTNLYVYLHFNCSQYPIDAKSLSFGYENYVKGYVVCFPPPSHVILPTYPTSTTGVIVMVSTCPISSSINVCSVFQTSGRRSIWDQSILDQSALMLHSKTSRSTVQQERELLSLANIASSDALAIVGISADLSTLTHPEVVKNLTVVDTTCEMFPQGQPIDLTSFTSLQILSLTLCNVPCVQVNLILTSTPLADASQECIVSETSNSTNIFVAAGN
ncbi:uncharacterized protein LOC135210170 [Macrobrachium nipponense]|uniref:uncharacterized protein LOC135210170 n=1 Tax=Macrobrachium nipponense TaxID=159736 RepID=UPI0030C7B5AD